MNFDSIIIGAGASGLIAARELTKAGKKVAILEARDRIGGRIHTLIKAGFASVAEAGAEFVHGDLPLTLELLKEADILFHQQKGRGWQVMNGELQQSGNFIEDWATLLDRLKQVEQDMSIATFLDTYFAEEQYAGLKASVQGFVEGYDAADTQKASVFALRDEWTSENNNNQYRMKDGYGPLMDFLWNESEKQGSTLYLSSVVKEIRWQPGQVEIVTNQSELFTAKQALVTVPLGVWQSNPEAAAHIQFSPPLPDKQAAAQQMGFGPVIKFLLEFKTAFWEEPVVAEAYQMERLGFLFSDASIPTWWTQLPNRTPVLTGWLAGPKAAQLKYISETELLDQALGTLAYLFHMPKATVQEQLNVGRVVNWAIDPFALGAYAYATVETALARNVLSEPVAATLFFAGEALYEGPEMGTVEAALVSGRTVAQQMLSQVVFGLRLR
jgi:monoamine oxidase